MDVDALARDPKGGKGKGKGDPKGKGKGDGKGTGKSKEDRYCHICGKKGHLKADCWYRDQKPDKPKGGKGEPKGGKGRGKGDWTGRGKGDWNKKPAQSLEEPEAEAGQAALELCAFQELASASDDGDWIKLNLDTGSAGTVFPMEHEHAEELEGKDGPVYKTATGELIDSGPGIKVHGENEWGQALTIRGRKAPVHKPLLSGGEVAEKNDVYLLGDGGWIISHRSRASERIRAAVEKVLTQESYAGVTPVYKERNVYNVYLRQRKAAAPRKKTTTWCQSACCRPADMCPSSEGGSGPASGGPRPGTHP